MKYAIAILALLASCNPVAAQRTAVVCPPHLSYCYEKPVLPQKTARDQYNDIVQEMAAATAAARRGIANSGDALRYELDRAHLDRRLDEWNGRLRYR